MKIAYVSVLLTYSPERLVILIVSMTTCQPSVDEYYIIDKGIRREADMATPNKNLKAVFEHLGLTNLAVAKALNIDPSLISRYLSGNRQLKAASPQMDAIADHILASSKHVQDVEWLKAQFIDAGLPTDMSTVRRLKQNLVLWLATDGDMLRRSLGTTPPKGAVRAARKSMRRVFTAADGGTKHSYLELLFTLEPLLSALQPGGMVEVYLSNDRIKTIIDGDVSSLLLKMIEQHDLHIRMVVCVSGDTQAMSQIIDTYIEPLVSGHVHISVAHGLTQTVTNQLHMILSDSNAVMVTETIDSDAAPVAVFVDEPDFIAGMRNSFETTARFAQPLLGVYDDNYSRDILEILYAEYCSSGDLDVVKDSINPIYMTVDAYERFLQKRGHSKEDFIWRSGQFILFKSGMDSVLKDGSKYREILSLSRLNDIAEKGFCRMAGLYFMERGYIDLDAEGCAAILYGYIEYLENAPNFSLLILDDLSDLHLNSCWHLKQGRSLAINNWQGKEPVMIYSDQLILLREFQERFDTLWERAESVIANRASVISILRDVAERLQLY